MIIKYEGKNYELGEITNIGDLEEAIKNKRITSLLTEGHLRWNQWSQLKKLALFYCYFSYYKCIFMVL